MSEPEKLLHKLLSSEVKADLLVLFHKNPGLVDTMDGVARRIGRTAGAIEKDAKELMDLGFLRNKRIGTSEVISFDRAKDKENREIIANHVRSLKIGGRD